MNLIGADLTCVRGGRRVFSKVNFSVGAGTALVLTGPNGAGKSSLLRMIAGLIAPAEGRLALNGGDGELSVAEQAHYVGHLDPHKPALTVMENLGFWARFLNGASAFDPAQISRGLEAVMHDHLAGGGLVVAATHAPLGLATAAGLRLGAGSDATESGSDHPHFAV